MKEYYSIKKAHDLRINSQVYQELASIMTRKGHWRHRLNDMQQYAANITAEDAGAANLVASQLESALTNGYLARSDTFTKAKAEETIALLHEKAQQKIAKNDISYGNLIANQKFGRNPISRPRTLAYHRHKRWATAAAASFSMGIGVMYAFASTPHQQSHEDIPKPLYQYATPASPHVVPLSEQPPDFTLAWENLRMVKDLEEMLADQFKW